MGCGDPAEGFGGFVADHGGLGGVVEDGDECGYGVGGEELAEDEGDFVSGFCFGCLRCVALRERDGVDVSDGGER